MDSNPGTVERPPMGAKLTVDLHLLSKTHT